MKVNDYTFYEIAPVMGSLKLEGILTDKIDISTFSDDDLLLHVKAVIGDEENLKINQIVGSSEDKLIDSFCKSRVQLIDRRYRLNIYTFEFLGDVSFIVIKYEMKDKESIEINDVLDCNYFLTRKYEFYRHSEVYPKLMFNQKVTNVLFHLNRSEYNSHTDKEQYYYNVDIMSYLVNELHDFTKPLFVSYKDTLLKRSFTYSLLMTQDIESEIKDTQVKLAKSMNHQYQIDDKFFSQDDLFENISYINAYEGTNFAIINNDLGGIYSLMKPKVFSHYFMLFLITKYNKYYYEKLLYELSQISDNYSTENEQTLSRLDSAKSLVMLRFAFENVSMHEHINLYYDSLQLSNKIAVNKEHLSQQFKQLSYIQKSFKEKQEAEREKRYKYYLKLFSIIAIISSIIGFFSSVWGLIESAHNDVEFSFKTMFSGSNIEYLVVFILSTILITIALFVYWYFNRTKQEGE